MSLYLHTYLSSLGVMYGCSMWVLCVVICSHLNRYKYPIARAFFYPISIPYLIKVKRGLSRWAIRLSLWGYPPTTTCSIGVPYYYLHYLTVTRCVIVCFWGVLWVNRGARVKSRGAKGGGGEWSGYPTKKT